MDPTFFFHLFTSFQRFCIFSPFYIFILEQLQPRIFITVLKMVKHIAWKWKFFLKKLLRLKIFCPVSVDHLMVFHAGKRRFAFLVIHHLIFSLGHLRNGGNQILNACYALFRLLGHLKDISKPFKDKKYPKIQFELYSTQLNPNHFAFLLHFTLNLEVLLCQQKCTKWF